MQQVGTERVNICTFYCRGNVQVPNWFNKLKSRLNIRYGPSFESYRKMRSQSIYLVFTETKLRKLMTLNSKCCWFPFSISNTWGVKLPSTSYRNPEEELR